MKTAITIILTSLFCNFLISTLQAEDEFLKISLSRSEFKILEENGLVLKTKEIKDAPWPEVHVATIIKNITALEAIAVFSTYEHQIRYIPDLKTAKIVKIVSPTDIHVAFTMNPPWPVPDSAYTTGNVLKKYEDEDQTVYEVSWYLVKSDSIIGSRGYARFRNFGKGTLFEYKTLVRPKSIFASLASGIMLDSVKITVIAIKNYLEKLKSEQPSKIKQYLTNLKIK